MRKEHVSHFIAIFCGIFIGALIAQSIANTFEIGKYFWFIGAAVGGTVAWIMVDPRKFFGSTKLASQYAWQSASGWKPDVPFWKLVSRLYLLAISMGTTSAVSCHLLAIFDSHKGWGESSLFEHVLFCFTIIFMLGSTFAFTTALVVTFGSFSVPSYQTKEMGKIFDDLIYWLSPLGVLVGIVLAGFYLIRWIFLAVRVAPKFTIRFIRFMKVFLPRFVRLLFLYTNHERRTASFVFAALGASVGYFIGYIPIVALIGALVGVLEFELTKSLREKLTEHQQPSST